MMVHPEPNEWLPAAHKRPRNDLKPCVCKLPTKPLFPFKSLIHCWESITPGPVWRVSLARLCMVWKLACLLRFGEVGVKTPTLFVRVCVCIFFDAKQNEMGTGDIDSCSTHMFQKVVRTRGRRWCLSRGRFVVGGCKGEHANTCSINQRWWLLNGL